MLVRKFEWGTDNEFGSDGWKLLGAPHFNAGLGLSVAHDTLEHFKTDSIVDEFMAFGAMLYIRAEGDYWANTGAYRTDPADQMSGDVGRFLYDSGDEMRNPGRTQRLDEDVEDIIERMKPLARREYQDMDDEADMSVFERRLEWAIGWMRKGYRKAVRRYYGNTSWHLMNLFRNIELEVDKRYKFADHGMILTVSVNLKSLEYRMECDYPRDYYDY